MSYLNSHSRPSYRHKTDVLDLLRLPNRRFDLNYRREDASGRMGVMITVLNLVFVTSFASLVPIALAFAVDVLALPAFPLLALLLGIFHVLITQLAHFLARGRNVRTGRRIKRPSILFWVLGPLAVWVYLMSIHYCRLAPISYIFLLPPALVAIYMASTETAKQYLWWTSANPLNSRYTLQRWRKLFQRRFRCRRKIPFRRPALSTQHQQLDERAQSTLDHYRRGPLYLVVIYLAAPPIAYQLSPHLPGIRLGSLVLCTWLALTLFAAIVRVRHWPAATRRLFSALSNYLDYPDTTLDTTSSCSFPRPVRFLCCLFLLLGASFFIYVPFFFFIAIIFIFILAVGVFWRDELDNTAISPPIPQTQPPWMFFSPGGSLLRRRATLYTALFMMAVAATLQFFPFSDLNSGSLGELLANIYLKRGLVENPQTQFIHVLCAALFPLLALVGNLLLLAGPVVSACYTALEAPGAYEHTPGITPWEGYRRRLAQSRNRQERNSKLLGLETNHGIPVLRPRGMDFYHTLVLGGPGSHKTHLHMSQQIEQDIRRRDSSVISPDNKGDIALFNGTRLVAEECNREFKWFTIFPGFSSFIFNIFIQAWFLALSLTIRRDFLLQIFALDHGPGYGRSHFEGAHADLIEDALDYRNNPKVAKKLEKRLPHGILNFSDLLIVMKTLRRTSSKYDQADETVRIVASLARIIHLNMCPQYHAGHPALDHAISMDEVVLARQILYLFLPGALSRRTVGMLNRLFLGSAYYAAVYIHNTHHIIAPVDYHIDEAQHASCQYLVNIIEQGRDYRFSVTLCCQNEGQFLKPGQEILSTIQEDTTTKRYFSIETASLRKEVSDNSGQVMHTLFSWQLSADDVLAGRHGPQHALPDRDGIVTVGTREELGNRLSNHDIDDASRHPHESILHFRQAEGPAQFTGYFVITTPWHITPREYKRRREELRFPEQDERTIVVSDVLTPPVPPASQPASPDDVARVQEKLRRIKRKRDAGQAEKPASSR